MKWLTRAWWAYLLEKPEPGSEPRWTVIRCRARGHAGEVFYNAGGLEPDHRCRNCLELIA